MRQAGAAYIRCFGQCLVSSATEATIGELWQYMMGDCELWFEFSGMAVLAMQNCGYSCLNPMNWGGKRAKASTKSKAYENRAHEGGNRDKKSYEQEEYNRELSASSQNVARVQSNGTLPKPPTGKGKADPSDRDPKRLFTPKERAEKRAEQENMCANGCGTEINSTNSAGHHIDRRADGGRTDSANHAEVCRDCHKGLHSK